MSSEKRKSVPLEEAINAVLRAEREAAAASAESEREASELIQAAREKEGRIMNRADRRIHMLHQRRHELAANYAQEIALREKRLLSTEITSDEDFALVSAAASAMADELLGERVGRDADSE